MCPVRNGRYFSYIIYKGKMDQIWPKKTIKWQKMVQLTQNLVIFCICGSFMNFENFGKIHLFLGDFWPKTRIVFNFFSKFQKYRDIYGSFGGFLFTLQSHLDYYTFY